MEKHYVQTVRLLLECTPDVFEFSRFAMKGGTALNLFVHDMPRLSVDIDVVYTDRQKGRTEALSEISQGLNEVKKRLTARGLIADFVTTREGWGAKLLGS